MKNDLGHYEKTSTHFLAESDGTDYVTGITNVTHCHP